MSLTKTLTRWLMIVMLLSVDGLMTPAANAAQKPNIIYIMADDLGYGDLGCFGQEVIQTPNIDRLAFEGMRLTDHYAGNTVCRPSRLSLWTGMHPGHTAISSNAGYHFEFSETTVAELLKKAGYATGGIGKWAMGGVGSGGHPNEHGFGYWFGYLDQGDAHNYYPTHLWENKTKFPLNGNVLMEHPQARGRVADKRVTYSHDVMTEKGLAWIVEHADRRFLFHFHYTIPHANNEGGRVTGDGMEVPHNGVYKNKDWSDLEKGFAAMISRLDRDVGRIIDLLKVLGIEQKTLVIFTSDNGPHHEGGHDHEFFDSNGPLRGYKRDLYDGGIRVPTIAWWPGTIESSSVSSHPSASWDFLPTACELAGVVPPAGIDGISYLPTLLGKPEQQKKHDFLFWHFRDKSAVRFGDWKAVQLDPDSPIELYDLHNDMGEEHDLADQHPFLIADLKAIMQKAYDPPQWKK